MTLQLAIGIALKTTDVVAGLVNANALADECPPAELVLILGHGLNAIILAAAAFQLDLLDDGRYFQPALHPAVLRGGAECPIRRPDSHGREWQSKKRHAAHAN